MELYKKSENVYSLTFLVQSKIIVCSVEINFQESISSCFFLTIHFQVTTLQKKYANLGCTLLSPTSVHQYFSKTATALPTSEIVTTKRSPYSLSSIIGNCSLPTNALTNAGVVLE